MTLASPRQNLLDGDGQGRSRAKHVLTPGHRPSPSDGGWYPCAEVDRLFQPFQRLGPRPARPDGHGHGLSIVRAIASAHAATISARPRPGSGLAIDVTFPRHPVPAPLLASSQATLEGAGLEQAACPRLGRVLADLA